MATKVSTTTAPAPPPPQAVPETQHAQESPEDELTITPVHKYFYFMVELSIVRTLVERGVLDAIPLEGQVSIEELAEQTGSELALLQRFIKFLVTAEVLTSPAPGQVGHTFKSTVFVHPKAKMFLMHLFDHFMGPATRWSEYFDDNGFKEPQSSQRTPLGLFTGYPDKSLYEIMPLLPGKKVAVFNATMAENIDEMPILGYYDFSWIGKHESIKADPSRTVFVDVGGGKGQALRAVLEENPDIPRGRCVLQDQARAINESIAEDHETMRSVTKIVSSFFEPQLIKGMYFFFSFIVLECRILTAFFFYRRPCIPDPQSPQ